MATYDLREAVNASASAVPSDVDEFNLAGVTKAACVCAPCSRVAESPIHFECRYLSTHRLQGNSPEGTVDVVFAKVEHIHIRDDAIGGDGKIDVKRLRPIARLGYYDYPVVDQVFEMRVPGANPEELAGLEGSPRLPG
jgi:flavin reductase (DIM6/NTAB) family NADH-FMN oxidoreductase RutF